MRMYKDKGELIGDQLVQVGHLLSPLLPKAGHTGPTVTCSGVTQPCAVCVEKMPSFLVKRLSIEGRRRDTRREQGLACCSASVPQCQPSMAVLPQGVLLGLSGVHRSPCHGILCFPPTSHHKIIKHLLVQLIVNHVSSARL